LFRDVTVTVGGSNTLGPWRAILSFRFDGATEAGAGVGGVGLCLRELDTVNTPSAHAAGPGRVALPHSAQSAAFIHISTVKKLEFYNIV